MKQWYESLFENYAQKYDKEVMFKGPWASAILLNRS